MFLYLFTTALDVARMTDQYRFWLDNAHVATHSAADTELRIDPRLWTIPDERIWHRAAPGTRTAFGPFVGKALGRIYVGRG